MILKCTFSYFLVYTPSPKILKQYSIKVKSPASHISATPPLPCLAALQVVSFTIGDMLKLLLCRAPQHCGVFCIAKYRGGGTK